MEKCGLIGSTLNNGVYEFGSKKDVGTQEDEARNTVILKVNGNITIKEGVTLTSCKSENGYGGPKGIVIYCTGRFVNNGITSMTARGAKAKGEDVYLWKNTNNSYEYIPALGALGASSVEANKSGTIYGNTGSNGINRQTGGGGSGGVRGLNSKSGKGGNGTSYSGGTGGGGVHGDTAIGTAGSDVGERGGQAGILENYNTWWATGGTGNPGGKSYYYDRGSYLEIPDGENGTGGLLVIFANDFENNNILEAKGTENLKSLAGPIKGGCSGGGSVNIFCNNISSIGNINTEGGSTIISGTGGTGSITIGNIKEGNFVCEYKNY